MRIERARTALHWSDIDQLQAQALPEDKPYSTAYGAWWVAYTGDRPVAFGGLAPSHKWSDAMYLCRVGVLQEYRGRGLQKRLIRVREAHARRAGMRWLITDTTDNPPSANSLIAQGFRIFQPAAPWGPKAATYWRKQLT